MIYIKTPEEIELQRQSALLVGATLAEVAASLQPGVTMKKLDAIAEQYIRDHDAVPSFKGYGGFPGSLCLSPNEQVVHGMPNDYVLQEGDIISIDCGVLKNQFHGDSAYTFAIGEVSEDIMQLLRATKASLYDAISKVKPNARIGDIGFAVQQSTEKKYGYGVVKDLVGHGVGMDLHEEPQVPNFGKRGNGNKLKKGMVIAIEPMINLGRREVKFWDDGWTVTTIDNKVSAHYEHTVAVTDKGYDILSSFADIELVEQSNSYLTPVII